MSKKDVGLLTGVTVLVILFFAWPLPELNRPYSLVVNDRDGQLLSAQVADDGQWRFPIPDSVPFKVSTAIRLYEDEYFYWHPGVNLVSVLRAMRQNWIAGKTVSGASTLTMQVARMTLNRPRTWWSKFLECLLTIRLELRKTKSELFRQYAAMAPFGGNVVGLEAASWRYFGRAPHLLSWGEAATLAILPNNPGIIYPGSSDTELLNKRNRLLKKLWAKGWMNDLAYELATDEPLPEAPLSLPREAPHLLTHYGSKGAVRPLDATLSSKWQRLSKQLMREQHRALKANGVENLAAMVVDLKTGEVLAYQGNTDDRLVDGHEVDVLQSRRSPGSTLKPMLFASALHKGLIQRRTLLPDVPSFFGGFSPKNFNRGYNGMVPAHQTLSRSLNIGFCHLLKAYTYQQFHYDLQRWGIGTLEQPADHYGLSLILGGCEVTPWELSQLYFSMYRKLAGLPNISIHFAGTGDPLTSLDIDRDAIWQTFQSMTQLSRPEGERNWRNFNSSQLIVWKTGTSFGFRDAWAIGMNGEVLVIVWAGNADGEGRAALTGIQAAAPLMLQLMNRSSHNRQWLKVLKPPMWQRPLCASSGLLPGPHCPVEKYVVTKRAERMGTCPYHQQLVMDASGTYEVNSSCYPLADTKRAVHFILPPIPGYYYGQVKGDYQGRPPTFPGCLKNDESVAIIYPNADSRIFIPIELDGSQGRVVLQAAHQKSGETLFWHIDQEFAGQTTDDHRLAVNLSKGGHELMVMDGNGRMQQIRFTVADD